MRSLPELLELCEFKDKKEDAYNALITHNASRC